jgi:predicted metal-dependent hydrolase
MSAIAGSVPVLMRVEYGSEVIDFVLTRRDRKTLAITVHPDLRVEVIAPLEAADDAVLARVQRRARWILRQRRQFLSWMPKPVPRRYLPGETHRYLGRQYRLKVIPASEPRVSLRGGFIEIHGAEPGASGAVKKQLDRWLRQQAEACFRKELSKALKRMTRHSLPVPKLRLLRMPKRWGSCTAKGEILLNPELIKAPAICVDYVIVHELCHLKHPNHGPAFFRMLDAVLPDWRVRKERLERTEI